MSRSYRKAIIKDRSRNYKKSTLYWRTVRHSTNNTIRSCKDLESLEIPHPRSIYNDYDYCDYVIDYEHLSGWFVSRWLNHDDERKKYRRK